MSNIHNNFMVRDKNELLANLLTLVPEYSGQYVGRKVEEIVS